MVLTESLCDVTWQPIRDFARLAMTENDREHKSMANYSFVVVAFIIIVLVFESKLFRLGFSFLDRVESTQIR